MGDIGLLAVLGAAYQTNANEKELPFQALQLGEGAAGPEDFTALINQKIEALLAEDRTAALTPAFLQRLQMMVAGEDGVVEAGSAVQQQAIEVLRQQFMEQVGAAIAADPEVAAKLEALLVGQAPGDVVLSEGLIASLRQYTVEPTSENLDAVKNALESLDDEALIGLVVAFQPIAEALPNTPKVELATISAAVLEAVEGRHGVEKPGAAAFASPEESGQQAAQSTAQSVLVALEKKGKEVIEATQLTSQTVLSSPVAATVVADIVGDDEPLPPGLMAFARQIAEGKKPASGQAPQAVIPSEVPQQGEVTVPPPAGLPAFLAGAGGESGQQLSFTSQQQAALAFASTQGEGAKNGFAALLPADGELLNDPTVLQGAANDTDILNAALKGAGDTSLKNMQQVTQMHREEAPARNDALVREQVVVHLQKNIETGQRQFVIHLDPADLGRVEVRLDTHHDGRTQIVIVADNNQTLDLLERDSRQLWKSLNEMGLELEHEAMEFQLSQDGGNQAEKDEYASSGNGENAGTGKDGTPFASTPMEQYERLIVSLNEGVNIRV